MAACCWLVLALLSSMVDAKPSLSLSPFSNVRANAANLCDVTQFGATGDGKTDDSAAISKALAAATCQGILFPEGNFLVSSTISVSSGGPFSMRGDGWSSNILWAHDGDLFNFPSSVAAAMISSLTVSSIVTVKSPNSTAFNFQGGLAKSTIKSVLFFGQGDIPGVAQKGALIGTAIDMGPVSDTNSVVDCVVWFCHGVAVKIGRGSEIRIEGGRLIGSRGASSSVDGIGVYVTGDNGGVHIIGTDVIGLKEGVRLDSSATGKSNREIFIAQATLDSNIVGLAVYDDSYVDVDGIWASSSDHDQIWVSPDSTGAVLSLTGGTIFNGGSEGGDCSLTGAAACNGITVNAGSFSLTGTAVRDNKGRGIWVVADRVAHYSISGCRVYGNNQGFKLSGSSYLVSGNVIFDNDQPNEFGSMAGGAIVKDNVGQ